MVNRVLRCTLDMAKQDDRDSYVNKRVDLTGALLNNLFRNYFNKLVKDMSKQIIKEIQRSAYGEVLEVKDAKESQLIYFHVDWHEHDEYLIVPAMAARSTVDVRTLAKVEESMPPEFWTWLSTGRRTPNQHNRHLVKSQ